MFDLQSQESLRRYQQTLLKMFMNFEVVFGRKWFLILDKTYIGVATLLEHGIRDFMEVYRNHNVDTHKLILISLRQIMAYFGTYTFQQFNNNRKSVLYNVKGMEDIYWETIKVWARRYAAKRVVDITKATERILSREIARGVTDGLTNYQIAKKIRDISPVFNKIRAKRIARTETHTASNKAMHEAVRSTQYKHTKRWVATIDDRTRGSNAKDRYNHIKANNQKRDLDELFDVSGEKLEYPGDPNASAGNIINCRCVVAYYTRK